MKNSVAKFETELALNPKRLRRRRIENPTPWTLLWIPKLWLSFIEGMTGRATAATQIGSTKRRSWRGRRVPLSGCSISLNERTIKRLMFVKPLFLSQEQSLNVLNSVGIKTGRDRGDERIILLRKTIQDGFKMIFYGNLRANSRKRIDNPIDVKKINADRPISLRGFQLVLSLRTRARVLDAK